MLSGAFRLGLFLSLCLNGCPVSGRAPDVLHCYSGGICPLNTGRHRCCTEF